MHPSADIIARIVARPTLRIDEPPRQGCVRTPLPRLALRVGLTGHRPDRLQMAARKAGLSRADYEGGLADRLAAAFAAIEAAVDGIHRDLTLAPGQPCFNQAMRPLLRLVAGLALGADTIAMTVVDGRFRGPPADEDRGAVRKLRQGGGPACEWQIDGILPCKLATFALDALPDLFADAAEPDRDAARQSLLAHWRRVSALPDTLIALPAQWRVGTPPASVPDWLSAETLTQLEQIAPGTIGGVEHAPDVPLRGGEAVRLDYGPAGAFHLRQVDMLVAVWDGQPSRGPGGAPDIVAAAVDLGIPVILIDADEPDTPPRLVMAVEREKASGEVVEWRPRPLSPICSDDPARTIEQAIRDILRLPTDAEATSHSHHDHRTQRGKLADFLNEAWPTTQEATTYRSFQNLVTSTTESAGADLRNLVGRRRVVVADETAHWSDDEWRDFIAGNPDEGRQAMRLKTILHRRFLAADILAVKYADLYRDAFIKAYLWAAVAVLIAILGFVLPGSKVDLWVKSALIGLELFVIWKIWLKVHRGESEHWHEKFVHYRALAESLRHMRFLATFAEYGEAGRAHAERDVWWLWYLRATVRELGLPAGQLDAGYQSALLRGVAKYEVATQIDWHRSTARREAATDRAVHDFGHMLFKVTGAVLVAGLVGFAVIVLLAATQRQASLATVLFDLKSLLPDPAKVVLAGAKNMIGLIASLLPTLGAALAGIRFTADFDGKAVRSIEMAQDLEAVRVELEQVAAAPDYVRSRAALRKTAEVLAQDVRAFLSMYGRKPLTLPG
jgi:hypothetical protein